MALLLLLIQALVVPAHRHAAAAAPSIAAAGTTIVTPTKSRSDHPADCPICREVAHAGQYLTPGGVQLPVATPSTLAPAVATRIGPGTVARSHFWRSRAPPVSAFS